MSTSPLVGHSPRVPKGPDGGPGSHLGIQPGADLHTAELPGLASRRRDAGRRVFGVLAVGLPAGTAGGIVGVLRPFLAPLDQQYAAFAGRVLRLVPLQFLVAREPAFARPESGIRPSLHVEFVVPEELHACPCRRNVGVRKHRICRLRREGRQQQVDRMDPGETSHGSLRGRVGWTLNIASDPEVRRTTWNSDADERCRARHRQEPRQGP